MSGMNRTDYELLQMIANLPTSVRSSMFEILQEMANGSTQRDLNGKTITGTSVVATTATIGGNILSGTELGFLDGVTAGTAAASKALVVDGSKNISGVGTITGTGFSGALSGALSSTSILNSGALTSRGLMFSSQTITATADAWDTDYVFTKLSHETVPIVKTGLTIEQGKLYIISQTSAGTAGHSVQLSAGTFDGTNNKATFDAQYETLIVFGVAAGRGVIVLNAGSVAMTAV